MVIRHLKAGGRVSDNDFDAIYTSQIREVSKIHFTPVDVAKTAARFLVEKPGAKVLDVGSGAGKFCMIGAACTNGVFTGVEQRKSLFQISELLSGQYGLSNATFIHSNILDIGFQDFDAIYFFNSFYENVLENEPIDDSIRPDKSLYALYAQYMKTELEQMPAGTRLATYFSYLREVPDSYKVQFSGFDGKLKLWTKVS